MDVFRHHCVIGYLNMLKTSLPKLYGGQISSIFSSNYEANASELLENNEKMLFILLSEWVMNK